ncbi:MAG: hypothetical protein ACOYON_10285 [Fimbriimonas sp.]
MLPDSTEQVNAQCSIPCQVPYTIVASPPEIADPIEYREIRRFFSPLAFSWLFMAIEMPIAIGVLSRLPNPKVSEAAYLVIMGIAMWIESPVIDLLTTSTTLSNDSDSYRQIRRFTFSLMAWVTIAHAGVAFTPLYGLVTDGLMHLPKELADSAQIGLQLLTPWSAFIGWRRFRQGILIRYGETRAVGIGTTVRVLTMLVSALGLPFLWQAPGVAIVSASLVFSVAAESMFVHFASASCVRDRLKKAPNHEPISTGSLVKFHLPLTLTTILNITALPAVGAALARTPDGVAQLAGYQVAQTLVWMLRTTTFALPEVVITLAKQAANRGRLRSFCLIIGVSCTFIQVIAALTGLDRWFFGHVLSAKPDTVELAHMALVSSSLMPLVGGLQSYLRGMLTTIRETSSRLYATVAAVTVLTASLIIGVSSGVPGVIFAPIAITLSLLADLLVLTYFWRKRSAGRLG